MLRVFCLVVLCGLVALPVGAEGLSAAEKRKLFKKKLQVLDSRAAQQYSGSVRLQPDPVVVPGAPGSERIPRYAGSVKSQYLPAAKAAAQRYGVPENLFLRLIAQESGWNARALSHKGAIGLAQLMPGTARVLRVNPHDPLENLDGGARYLAEQYRTCLLYTSDAADE